MLGIRLVVQMIQGFLKEPCMSLRASLWHFIIIYFIDVFVIEMWGFRLCNILLSAFLPIDLIVVYGVDYFVLIGFIHVFLCHLGYASL